MHCAGCRTPTRFPVLSFLHVHHLPRGESMKRKLREEHGVIPPLLIASPLLAASPGDLQPGTPINDVIARMGQPTGEYRGPDGTRRVEFARGPAGKHTYMVDVNPQGQVVKWEQVLTDQKFSTLMVGMSEADVLYT